MAFIQYFISPHFLFLSILAQLCCAAQSPHSSTLHGSPDQCVSKSNQYLLQKKAFNVFSQNEQNEPSLLRQPATPKLLIWTIPEIQRKPFCIKAWVKRMVPSRSQCRMLFRPFCFRLFFIIPVVILLVL